MADDNSPAKRRLMNKAVHYLGRYTASRQRLREVLGRFADRKLDAHDADEVATAREQVIDDCIRLGYVDDASFALSQARGKRRAGRSGIAIKRALGQHAIEDEIVHAALAEADAGILFHAPDNVINEFPQFPAVQTFADLKQEFIRASNRNLSL